MYADDGSWASRLALKDKAQVTVSGFVTIIKVCCCCRCWVYYRMLFTIAVATKISTSGMPHADRASPTCLNSPVLRGPSLRSESSYPIFTPDWALSPYSFPPRMMALAGNLTLTINFPCECSQPSEQSTSYDASADSVYQADIVLYYIPLFQIDGQQRFRIHRGMLFPKKKIQHYVRGVF